MTAVLDTSLDSFFIEGEHLAANIAEAVTGATLARTIDGTTTVTLAIHDDRNRLLKSGIFASKTFVSFDDVAYELVQVRKSARTVTVTFEDRVSVTLRARAEPRNAAPNTTTRAEFIGRLVAEVPGARFDGHIGEKAKVELATGQTGATATPGQPVEPRNWWDASGQIAAEVQWRRWCDQGAVSVFPDDVLKGRDAVASITEESSGVDAIDFDFDQGKPVASMRVQARAARWSVPVGSVIEVAEMGAGNGKWLVTTIDRSLFSRTTVVVLEGPKPALPEPSPPPPPPAAPISSSPGAPGAPSSGGFSGTAGNVPLTTVQGITVHVDIADEVNRLVIAARAAGFHLTGGGYRSPARQIELRRQNCGTSNYAIYEMPSSQCSPPTARPGSSNHERGLAIDFSCNGSLIRSRSTACFRWLAANAARYGLYNLPSEPWHWSVNGS